MVPTSARAARLTFPRLALEALLPRLLEAGLPAFTLAGKVTHPEVDEYLIADAEVAEAPLAEWRSPTRHQTRFIVRAGPEWRAPDAWSTWLQSSGLPQQDIGLIALTPEGDALGWVHDGIWWNIAEFAWPGPRMERSSCATPGKAITDPGNSKPVPARDSRLAGALSPPVLARLRGLAFAVVGVSRLGSLVAHSLARWGVQRIVLIDPDRVEAHSADAGEFDPSFDEGMPKVKAVARAIARLPPPDRRVQAWSLPLNAPLAFAAARSADVIVSCMDNDGARLLASVLAASHLRPHLDLGVRVGSDEAGRRSAGADIRLVLPEAMPWCLACFGGFARPSELRSVAGLNVSSSAAWSDLRAGSLRTVNQIAAHLGLRLIERLASGEVARSTWLRYEDAPIPSLREIVPPRPWSCLLCRQYPGTGDAVHEDREARLRRLAQALAGAEGVTGVIP